MTVEWNLNHLYINDKKWKNDYEKLIEKVRELESLIDSFMSNKESFLTYIEKKIYVDTLVEKVYCYPKRHTDLDSSNLKYKEDVNKSLTQYGIITRLNSTFENNIISNKNIVIEYLNDKRLKKYKRYIDLIFLKQHHISDNKDILESYKITLNNIKDNYQNIISNMKFDDVVEIKKYTLNRTTYDELIINENPNIRRKTFLNYTKSYSDNIESFRSLYIEKIKNDISLSKSESYNSLLEKKLSEFELPLNLISNLIETTHKKIDIMQDYRDYKKNCLGLKEFHIYDSHLSICDIPNITYSLEDSIEIIKNSLAPLGKDYIQVIDKMFKEGWIDVYPKDNKRVNPFTCISYSGVPYILTNFNGNINSIRTLVHEIGHSINTYYSKNNNPFMYFEFSIFLTEIASKVNEMLFNEYMLKNASDEEKRYILNNIISSLEKSMFGQVMLTEFEDNVIKNIEKSNELSVNELNKIYFNINKKYNDTTVDLDEEIKYGWLKIPHYITQDPYYLYQYSIGTAIAANIAKRILNHEKGFVLKYKEFLSLGNKVNVNEALENIGISLNNNNYLNDSYEMINDKIKLLKRMQ